MMFVLQVVIALCLILMARFHAVTAVCLIVKMINLHVVIAVCLSVMTSLHMVG